MQIISFLCHIIFSCVACLTVRYFSTLYHKECDFRKKSFWTWNMCSDFLYNLCPKHFSFWEELSKILSHTYTGFHIKYPLFLAGFNQISMFVTDFQKILKYKISWKSSQWELSCSMWISRQTDRQADMTKLAAAFCNFVTAPKKDHVYQKHLIFVDRLHY